MAATMDVATAAANGDILTVQSLVSQNVNVNRVSRDGMTPLAVASFWGYADIVEVLLRSGADINVCNKGTLWTATHCAAFQGHGKVLMKLMAYRPDLTLRDNQGRSAVDFASALDSIWSIFAAVGCTRTPKSELIRLDIVKKISYDPTSVPSLPNSDMAHFSRPGSAYVIKAQPLRGSQRMDQNMAIASATGDVLAGTEDSYSHHKARQPQLSLWNH